MSLFSDAGLGDFDLNSIPDTGYERIPDGVYEATVTDVYVREGTTNKPDAKWINVEYTLADGHQELEWFQLPENPAEPTEKEAQKLGFLKRRMIDLGVAENRVNTVKPDELIDLDVVITLRTKGGYQNISRVDLVEKAPEEEAAPAPAVAPISRGVRRPNPAAR